MYGNRFLDMCDSIEQDIYEKKNLVSLILHIFQSGLL